MATPTVKVCDYNGAEVSSVTVEAGQPVILGLGHRTYINLADGTYKWTASGETDTYYLELVGGGNPGITWGSNGRAYWHGRGLDEGSATDALTPMQWKTGDSNTLGYTTLYIRIPSGYADPDGLGTWGTAWAKDNTNFSWGAGDHATCEAVEWMLPDGTRRVGFNVGFEAASSGTVICRVVNEDGVSGTARVTLTVDASTRTAKYATAAGNDTTGDGSEGNPYRTLDKIITTHGTTDNIEARLEGGTTFTLADNRTISGDNWRVCTHGGTGRALVDDAGDLTISQCHNFQWVGVDVYQSTIPTNGVWFSSGSAAAPCTRHLYKDVTYTGTILSVFQYDRHGSGHAIENVRAGDLSAAGGIASYFLYDVSRADAGLDGRPFKFLSIHNCSNDYGNQDEVVVRTGGDFVTMTRSYWEQTNITEGPNKRTKTAGLRIVSGDWYWIEGNTFAIPEDTSGISNTANGIGGISWAPTASLNELNGSTATRGVVILRNRMIGTNIMLSGGSDWGGTDPMYYDDTVIRCNIFDWAYNKQESAVMIGSESTTSAMVNVRNLYIQHNTFYSVTQDNRCISFLGLTGLRLTGLRVDNNLCSLPNQRIQNNDTAGGAFLIIRSADNGAAQFTSFNNNVWAVPDESLAGGDWPEGGFSMVNFPTTGSVVGTLASAATINGYAYSTTDNTREDVTLDAAFRISGSPTAKTQGTRSTGCRYDYYGRLIPSSGGAVGAVQPGTVYTAIQAGANVLAISR
jgi:hypothetical protein